jgi:hypothetical protein
MRRVFGMAMVLAVGAACIATPEMLSGQEKKAAAADKDGRKQLLETVGALAAVHLYQSYLNIGLIADGKAEGIYGEKESQQILASVLPLMDMVDKQLAKVSKLDMDKQDRDGLEQLGRLSKLLRQQAEELQAFWKTGDKERGAKYEKLRKEAWEGISKLLGLNK